jgi:hypothetical protein
LPFTHDQFLDVFAAYNTTLWAAAAALWLLTAWVLCRFLRQREQASRLLSLALAVHWAWSALAYHVAFFSRINPAAWFFASLFVVQAGLFVWLGAVRERLRFRLAASFRGAVAIVILAYGLLYPAAGLLLGLAYPRMPTFGVPCPTALVTVGVLLVALPGSPRSVNVIPLVWTAVGGSAAFILGIRADLGLVVAGSVLLVQTLAPALLGRQRFTPGSTAAGPGRLVRGPGAAL